MSNSPSLLPLRPFHLPFHLCSPSIFPSSPSFPSSHLCLCLLLGLSPWWPNWALRPTSGLANMSGEKEWKRRGVRERERKPERERETRSKTLSRHGSEKYICLGKRVQHSSFNYLLRRTQGNRSPKCRNKEKGQEIHAAHSYVFFFFTADKQE